MTKRGWFRESKRHSLAAKGIKTNGKIKHVRYNFVFFKNLNYFQARKIYGLKPYGDVDKDG